MYTLDVGQGADVRCFIYDTDQSVGLFQYYTLFRICCREKKTRQLVDPNHFLGLKRKKL